MEAHCDTQPCPRRALQIENYSAGHAPRSYFAAPLPMSHCAARPPSPLQKRGDGSPCALPKGEPQTAQKEAEKAAAPSDSLEAADEEEADEDVEWEDDECCQCGRKAEIDHSEQGLLCREHAFGEALWEAEKAGEPRARRHAAPPRPAKGTPAAEEQAARKAELRRLAKRKRNGRASSGSEGDDADEETAERRKRVRQQATDMLRIRYALRHGRPADVIRYLRAAVRGTDAASAAAATALAAVLPERRWPAEVRPGRKRARRCCVSGFAFLAAVLTRVPARSRGA